MNNWKSKADWKDPNWKYVPAAATDVSRTIARVKREMAEVEKSKPAKLVQIKKVGNGK